MVRGADATTDEAWMAIANSAAAGLSPVALMARAGHSDFTTTTSLYLQGES